MYDTEPVNDLTILEHFGKILDVLTKDGLCKDFYLYAKDSLKAASQYLETTQRQAAFFALLLDNFSSEPLSIIKLGEILKCGNLEMLQYIDDFEALAKKRLIRHYNHDRYVSFMNKDMDNFPKYFVPVAVINAVRKGKAFKPKSYSNVSPQKFFDNAADLLDAKKDDDIDLETLDQELNSLMALNKHIHFVKALDMYKFGNGSIIILFYFCCELLHNNNETLQIQKLFRLLGREARRIQRRFESREHKLFENQLVEFDCQMGMADNESYRLTAKAIKEFLGDINLKEIPRRRGNDIVYADSINAKKMYFSEKTEDRIKELSNLLQEDNFINIQKRLYESGMRTGFPCIFCGPPGTGKTETVYQIARETGRDIFLVDIAESKSKWFGESEKCIKSIFDRYRGIIKSGNLAPILFFNEADAILGKRRELSNYRSGPDQTENAIQNILLQEMEDMKGILIATTNLTINLDNAFDRRFLYKIEFEKPDIKTKKRIWQDLVPGITSEDAEHLAAKFSFSGGEIENISRKCTVDFVLQGNKPSLDRIITLCNEEELHRGTGSIIGFRT